MPTPEEQALINQKLARQVASGALSAGQQVHKGPELPPGETEKRLEGWQPELTDEEVASRMGEVPEETAQNQFINIVERMAQNYQTSPEYKVLLDQELQQISAQIAELTQRRNMIEMARRG